MHVQGTPLSDVTVCAFDFIEQHFCFEEFSKSCQHERSGCCVIRLETKKKQPQEQEGFESQMEKCLKAENFSVSDFVESS